MLSCISRILGNECLKDLNTTGDRLIFLISVVYPRRCYSKRCRKDFSIMVDYNLKLLYYRITLTITFTNGRKVNVQLGLCTSNTIPETTSITITVQQSTGKKNSVVCGTA